MPGDPKRFAGKVGIDSGPVPLRRWMPSAVAVRPAPSEMATSDNQGVRADKQMRTEQPKARPEGVITKRKRK